MPRARASGPRPGAPIPPVADRLAGRSAAVVPRGGVALLPRSGAPFRTSAHLDAEQLLMRLGRLLGADAPPARIVLDVGLRRRQGLLGLVSSRAPHELHVDPGLDRFDLLM